MYSEQFVQLRIQGHFGPDAATAVDFWSVGLKLRNPTSAPTPGLLLAFLVAVDPAVRAFHLHASVLAGSNTYLKAISAAFIGTDGKYVGGATQDTVVRQLSGSNPGAGASPLGPWTQAVVTSLRTAVTRGRASNGRMYYPAPAMTVQPSTGTISSTNTANYATQAAILINAINTQADTLLPGNGGVSVMSQVGAGRTESVTSVRIGNRLDRQERRENAITEAYSSGTVNPVTGFVVDRSSVPIGT